MFERIKDVHKYGKCKTKTNFSKYSLANSVLKTGIFLRFSLSYQLQADVWGFGFPWNVVHMLMFPSSKILHMVQTKYLILCRKNMKYCAGTILNMVQENIKYCAVQPTVLTVIIYQKQQKYPDKFVAKYPFVVDFLCLLCLLWTEHWRHNSLIFSPDASESWELYLCCICSFLPLRQLCSRASDLLNYLWQVE